MEDTVTITGEKQWFQPLVRNRLSKPIILANFRINYGKFYDISAYLHHFRITWFIDKCLS